MPAPSKLETGSNWGIKLFTDQGVNLDLIAQDHPEEVALLRSTNSANYPLNAAATLMEAAARQINEPNIGLRMGQTVDLKDMDTYGYLLLNTETVEEFLGSAAHYDHLLVQTGRLIFIKGPLTSRFEYQPLQTTTPPLSPRHDNELGLSLIVNFIQKRLPFPWTPVSVHFAHPAPDNLSLHHEVFGDQLYFDHSTNHFDIPNSLLDYRLNSADPHLSKIVKSHADNLMNKLEENEHILDQVKLIIMKGISEDGVSAEQTATALGMSNSTLKRRLSSLNENFRSIRDDAISSVAKDLLSQTNNPISTIASQLGFSEPAAFDRSFKRITNMTPRQYRKLYSILPR